MHNNTDDDLTREDLKEVEHFADNLFKELGIDVAFTNHFFDRLNDPRNGRQITVFELKELFQEAFNQLKDEIGDMNIHAEAVINDVSSRLNIPFVLVYDKRNNEIDLVAKTIMRKKDFKSRTPKFKI